MTGGLQAATLLGLDLVSLAAVSIWSLFIRVSDLGITDLFRAESSRMLLSGSAMGVVGLIMQSLVRNRFVAPTTAGTVEPPAWDWSSSPSGLSGPPFSSR